MLISGCATRAPEEYAGPPDAVVLGATRRQALDWLINERIRRGSRISNTTDFGFMASTRVEGSLTASLLFGSRYDATPNARLVYQAADVPGGVHVFVKAEMVTNPGSAFERITDVTVHLTRPIAEELQDLQAAFAPTRRQP